jgi:hypothetical protein
MAISKIKSNSLQDDIALQGKTVKLPKGTTAERPTGTQAELEAQFRYNDTLNKTELYDGRKWDQVNTQTTSIALNIALGS